VISYRNDSATCLLTSLCAYTSLLACINFLTLPRATDIAQREQFATKPTHARLLLLRSGDKHRVAAKLTLCAVKFIFLKGKESARYTISTAISDVNGNKYVYLLEKEKRERHESTKAKLYIQKTSLGFPLAHKKVKSVHL
jgi:hypothetical protein